MLYEKYGGAAKIRMVLGVRSVRCCGGSRPH